MNNIYDRSCYKLVVQAALNGYLRYIIVRVRACAHARPPLYGQNHISTQPPTRQMDSYTDAGSLFLIYD